MKYEVQPAKDSSVLNALHRLLGRECLVVSYPAGDKVLRASSLGVGGSVNTCFVRDGVMVSS